MKVREVVTYKGYFDDFFKVQPQKVRDKIIKILDVIEQVDRIPSTNLKYIEGTNGFLRYVSDLVATYSVYSAYSLATSS